MAQEKEPFPIKLLKQFTKRNPNAFAKVDAIRSKQSWRKECFIPATYAFDILGFEADPNDLFLLPVLSAWRVTKGIYKFDPDLWSELNAVSIDCKIPCDILLKMPEWCIYLYIGDDAGAFYVINEELGNVELRIYLAAENGIMPIIMHLGDWSFQEGFDRAIEFAVMQYRKNNIHNDIGESNIRESYKHSEAIIAQLLSGLLFIITQSDEVGNGRTKPYKPTPIRTKLGLAMPQAEKPKIWDVGVRMGATLRRYNKEQSDYYEATGRTVRPHIRRAHWHGYWTGPRDSNDRKFIVKWIPPTFINTEDSEDLPAVIKKVN